MTNWILVEDQLPEQGILVVFVFKYSGSTAVGMLHDTQGDCLEYLEIDYSRGNNMKWADIKDVSHWHPLPAPPK